MQLLRLLVSWAVLILAFASCGSAPPQPQVNRPPIPTPSAGMSTLYGQVIGSSGNAPIKKTPIYLAAIHWDAQHKNAAYALDISHGPATTTDQNGFFVFTELPPNEYALVVGDFYGQNDVVRESNGNARIYQPEAGKTLDAGVVQVNPSVQVSGT